MSETILFTSGTVVFFAVATAVFLYGLAVFRELQVRDETATRILGRRTPEHPNGTDLTGRTTAASEPAPTLSSAP